MCSLVPALGFCCSKQEFLNRSGMQNQMEKKKKKNFTHILYHDLYIAMKEKDRAPHNPQFPQPQNRRILPKCYAQSATSGEKENDKIVMCISRKKMTLAKYIHFLLHNKLPQT